MILSEAKKTVKQLKNEIKKAKENLDFAQRENLSLGIYEDCGSFYQNELIIAQEALSDLIILKIRAEKYVKKLRHEEKGE